MTKDIIGPPSPKRVAYADPPYLGQAKRHYSHDSKCAEVNHPLLIQHLLTYDGWAVSCTSTSLQELLPICPPDVRIGVWVKSFAAFKKGANPAYAWEGVLYRPCRRRTGRFIVRDWVEERITMKKGLCGVKPDRFCYWLFEILALEPEDELDDLFPGSGAVGLAWERWRDKELERRVTGEPHGLYVQSRTEMAKMAKMAKPLRKKRNQVVPIAKAPAGQAVRIYARPCDT